MYDFVEVHDSDERLSIRNHPPSWLAGLTILGFYLLFAVVAGVSLWQLAPGRLADQWLWTVLPVAAFGLLMLWLAVFAISYQQVVLDARGLHYTRRVLGVPIWRRSFPLPDVRQARSGFRESPSDTPDLHWLAIETRGSEVRLTTQGNVDRLCLEFQRRLSRLRSSSPAANERPHGKASDIG